MEINEIREVRDYVGPKGKRVKVFSSINNEQNAPDVFVGGATVMFNMQTPDGPVSRPTEIEFIIEDASSLDDAFDKFETYAEKEIQNLKEQYENFMKEQNSKLVVPNSEEAQAINNSGLRLSTDN